MIDYQSVEYLRRKLASHEVLTEDLDSAAHALELFASLLRDIGRVNRDVSDAIDNDGTPYQSAALDATLNLLGASDRVSAD